jgi:hypothetical protein
VRDPKSKQQRSGLVAKLVRVSLMILVVATAAAYVVAGARNPWDFETYFYAATAYRVGLNPYSLDALSRVAHKSIELPFLYPPITLAVFIPLSLLPSGIAAATWLALKSLLLVFLLWVWRREFLPSSGSLALVAVTLLGFNLAVLWDLRIGNVALVETVLLWLAFLTYLRHRDVLTAYLVAMASVFKILPILLLGLLAMSRRPPRARLALIAFGLATLLALVAFPMDLSAEWVRALGRSSGDSRPVGEINPSALGLSDWLVSTLELPATAAPSLALGLYLLYCAAVLVGSLGALLRAHASRSRVEQVVLVVLIWLVILPRVMVYSFSMAVVPVLYVIESRIRVRLWRWVAVGLVLLEGVVRLVPGRPPQVLGPLSFLILLGALALCVGVEPRPGMAQQFVAPDRTGRHLRAR